MSSDRSLKVCNDRSDLILQLPSCPFLSRNFSEMIMILLVVSSLPRESTNWFISNTTKNKLDSE